MAALYRATDRVSVWGSFSKGFRAPTLKELYSPFRVGPGAHARERDPRPERLTGEEVGVSVAATERVTVRGTFFNNRVNDPIANVTVATNNVPVTRVAPAYRSAASSRISAARTSAGSRPTCRIA